jgi:hypothetical protein
VANGFAFAAAPAGRALEEALVLAEQVAAHHIPALMANKRLIRDGWADAIARAWSRERAAMVEVADQIGPIGGKTDS